MLAVAAVAKSLQSCPTLCDPIDGSPPGSPVPGILQARTLEWVSISFSNAWKWKWKWSLSVMSNSSRPHGLQPTRLLRPWDFPGKSTGVGCHCLIPRNTTECKTLSGRGFQALELWPRGLACGIFPVQGSNSNLLRWQVDFFTAEPPGKPQPPLFLRVKNSLSRRHQVKSVF